MINYDEKLYSLLKMTVKAYTFCRIIHKIFVASPANLDHMPNIHIRSKYDLYRCIYM